MPISKCCPSNVVVAALVMARHESDLFRNSGTVPSTQADSYLRRVSGYTTGARCGRPPIERHAHDDVATSIIDKGFADDGVNYLIMEQIAKQSP
ncbi:MAG: hypothetical protein U0936_22475 [Planctomycetaceae bacterium]